MADGHNHKPLSAIADPYRRAYALFEKIQTLEVGGKPIVQAFEWNGTNLWHHVSQRLFGELLDLHSSRESSGNQLRETVLRLLLAGISIIALGLARVRRPQVLVYSVDITAGKEATDPRIAPVYEALATTGASYLEYFHAQVSRKPFSNLWQRQRLALYHEGLDVLLSVVPAPSLFQLSEREIRWDGWHPEDRAFIEPIVKQYIKEALREAGRITILRKIIRFLNPCTIISIDDPRYYGALIHAARAENVPTVAVQHGHLSKYHVGWRALPGARVHAATPDRYLVWSEYWKRELQRLNSHYLPECIEVGGLKSLPQKRETNLVPKELAILVPFETVAPHAQVRAYLDAIAACGNVRIFFKLRPDMSRQEQLKAYGFAESTPPWLSVISEIPENTPIPLAAGVYSTMLYDVLEYGMRAIILSTSMDYGEGMVANKVADLLTLDENLCITMQKLAQSATEVASARAVVVHGTHPILMKDTLAHLLLDAICHTPRP